MKKVFSTLHTFLVTCVIFPIRLYKKFLSPLLPSACRYYPTCSEYTVQALEKYGLIKGTCKSVVRLFKCNPFYPGGYDPV
jgi:uncharacterized protein